MRTLLALILMTTASHATTVVTCPDISMITIYAEVTYNNPTPRGIVIGTAVTIFEDDIIINCEGNQMTIFGTGSVSIIKEQETAIFIEQLQPNQ